MLSNNNEFVFPYIKETLFRADGLALEDYFDKCYLSYEMHELKPSPAIFGADDRRQRRVSGDDARR